MKLCFIAPGHSYHTVQWIKFFSQGKHDVYLIDVGHELNNSLIQLGVKCDDVTSKRKGWGALPWMVHAILEIRKKVSSLRPDLVHAFPVFPAGFLAAESLESSVPFVITGWGSEVLVAPWRSWMIRLCNRLALKRANLLTAESLPVLSSMAWLRGSPCNGVLIQFGAELDIFKPAENKESLRQQLNLPKDKFIIFSGRAAIPNSNLEVVLKSFHMFLSEFPNAILLFAYAYGNMEEKLRGLCSSLGILENVLFLGAVEYKQMAAVLSASDVCVSVPSSDSFPRIVWESMASGVPVVISDLPWRTGYIEDGVHALVVAPGDELGLFRALERLVSDTLLRTTLINNGLELVRARGDYLKEMKRMEQIYEAICRRSLSIDDILGVFQVYPSDVALR
ncbi:MAG TPA: glycosyltransferase family 4 protein [Syntrophomonadaceae bacterium]|nr:glycosyltransferase family 4 protein [Syntrophomonadaceae bacterium]